MEVGVNNQTDNHIDGLWKSCFVELLVWLALSAIVCFSLTLFAHFVPTLIIKIILSILGILVFLVQWNGWLCGKIVVSIEFLVLIIII